MAYYWSLRERGDSALQSEGSVLWQYSLGQAQQIFFPLLPSVGAEAAAGVAAAAGTDCVCSVRRRERA